MSDLKIYDDYNTLPEQVQINKDDIKTNTADIAKLKDDIGKVKTNAWEERKFNVNEGSTPIEFTTYNPITDSNTPVNIQKSFIDKETYSLTDKINSFSFSASSPSIFAYLVCGDPSLTLNELFGLEESAKNYIVLANTDVGGDGQYWLLINCRLVDTFSLFTSSLSFDRKDTDIYIDKISTADDKREHSMLTAKAVDQYYLKKSDASNTYLSKTDASNTYLSKTDASNTYVTKQDYEERLDTGDIQFTAQGWTKFKAITDTEGQTIELHVPADLLEHVQVTGTNDLKLQLVYNSHAVFENVYLHPNNTINDLDSITGAKTTYYTGQAILTLSSQSNGLFYIVYQEGVGLTLHLITTI